MTHCRVMLRIRVNSVINFGVPQKAVNLLLLLLLIYLFVTCNWVVTRWQESVTLCTCNTISRSDMLTTVSFSIRAAFRNFRR